MNGNKHVHQTKMKTLSKYKMAYKNAKTQSTKSRIMTNADLNLSYSDFQAFMSFTHTL